MKKNLTLLWVFCCFCLITTYAQMTPARSDAYQGNYAIRTGIGSPEWLKPSTYFRLYSNLHLVAENPINHNVALFNSGATSYPYFNSYQSVLGLDSTFNWFNWAFRNTARPPAAFWYNEGRTPAEAEAAGTLGYKEYNKYYGQSNSELTLSTAAATPTLLYTRINQKRNGILLSLYTLYTLEQRLINPMTDLRVTGIDNSVQLLYRNWFNSPFLVNSTGQQTTAAEYLKINAANNLAAPKNSQNSGEGTPIIDFNKNFDSYMSTYSAKIAWNTEGAVELTGLRTINYNNDPDVYGVTQKGLKIKFRMLTVGGIDNVSPFIFTHTSDPWQISDQHFIDININRPAMAFSGTDAGASNYMGTALTMEHGSSTTLTPISLNITETPGSLIPRTETTTQTPVTIDDSRVRVSLVLKTVYDAAVADGSIATNNDLATVNGFAYLTQSQLESIQSTVPAGDYVIKYDYSSPDSKTQVKSEGSGLGEIFAKSIYRPLSVTSTSLPVTFSYLNAVIANDRLSVNWTTFKEADNSHFEIQVSKDGKKFKTIANVASLAPSGRSDTPLNYSFSIGLTEVLSAASLAGLLLMLPFSSKRKRMYTLAVILVLIGVSCSKQATETQFRGDETVFVRIAQVDKNGTTAYSTIVKAIIK